MLKTVFKENLSQKIETHKRQTGENLRAFAIRVLGPEEAEYKWLRKVLSEGSALKRAGTMNHERLFLLHKEFQLDWPDLWKNQQSLRTQEAVKSLLPTSLTDAFRSALAKFIEHLELEAEGDRLLLLLENWRPTLHDRLVNASPDKLLFAAASVVQQVGLESAFANIIQSATEFLELAVVDNASQTPDAATRKIRSDAEHMISQLENDYPAIYSSWNERLPDHSAKLEAAFSFLSQNSNLVFQTFVNGIVTEANGTTPNSDPPYSQTTTETPPSSNSDLTWDDQMQLLIDLTARLGQTYSSKDGTSWWEKYRSDFTNDLDAKLGVAKQYWAFTSSGRRNPVDFPFQFWSRWQRKLGQG